MGPEGLQNMGYNKNPFDGDQNPATFEVEHLAGFVRGHLPWGGVWGVGKTGRSTKTKEKPF